MGTGHLFIPGVEVWPKINLSSLLAVGSGPVLLLVVTVLMFIAWFVNSALLFYFADNGEQ